MIPDTPSSAASGMGLVEELRAWSDRIAPLGWADVGRERILRAADALSAKDRELAEARAHEANLIKRRDHYRECMESAGRELNAISAAIGTTRFMDPPDGGDVSLAEQVKRMRETLTTAERARDEALSALREMKEAQGYAQLAAAGWELESARLKSTEAEIKRLRAMEAAFQKPFSVLFLDGRNEHGTHVLPCLPTNLPPEYESDLVEQAEEIMVEAERLGFKSGEDMVWSVWTFNQPQYGDEGRMEFPGYWEFVGIDVPMSEWLRAQSALENGPASLADATQNPSVSREQRGEEA